MRLFPALAVVLGLLVPMVASAFPVNVRFTVNGDTEDPLWDGNDATGFFQFDTETPPNANGVVALNLLRFTWEDHKYTEATYALFALSFDADGVLTEWGLQPAVSGPISGIYAFAISRTGLFIYGNEYYDPQPGLDHAWNGFVTTWSVEPSIPSVPEPKSAALVALGLMAAIFLSGSERRGR